MYGVENMKKEIKIFPKAENNEDKKAIQNCLEKKGIWNCRNCTILNCELVEGQNNTLNIWSRK